MFRCNLDPLSSPSLAAPTDIPPQSEQRFLSLEVRQKLSASSSAHLFFPTFHIQFVSCFWHSQGILDPICPAPSWSMAASPFAWTVVLISYPVPRSWPCCRQLLSTAARMITDMCISLVAPPPQAPRRLLFSLTVKCWTKGHKSLHNLAHLLILWPHFLSLFPSPALHGDLCCSSGVMTTHLSQDLHTCSCWNRYPSDIHLISWGRYWLTTSSKPAFFPIVITTTLFPYPVYFLEK